MKLYHGSNQIFILQTVAQYECIFKKRKTVVIFLLYFWVPCWLNVLYAQFQPPSPDRVYTIPLEGNSYITERGSKSAFFRTNRTGSLTLYLNYNAPAKSKIKVSCAGKTFKVDLPAGTNRKVKLGTINRVDSGYVRVDLKEIDTSVKASSLLVEGTATGEGMNYVNDFSFYWGRRGPSVHLSYTLPENEDIEWFYNEITVPVGADPVGTYYMSNGFAQGYFGIQVNSPTERRVLFSVWSPFQTDNPKDIPETHQVKLLQKGENVKAGEFGSEGSGGQSYLIYPWITGNTYKFLTHVKPDGNGSTVFTSYFYAPEKQKWMLIASFSRPLTDTYYKNAHSFLESFNPETGYLTRKALYSNQWARTKEGKWIQVSDKALFTVDETGRKKARMDYKGGIEGNAFFLQNCGFFNDYISAGTVFAKELQVSEPLQIDLKNME